MTKKKHKKITHNLKRNRKKLGLIDKENKKKDIQVDRGQLSDWYKKQHENKIKNAIEQGKKELEQDFFIVTHIRNEKGYSNVLPRDIVRADKACPWPTADQHVYRYHKKEDRLELLWMVPSRDMCIEIQVNPIFSGYDQQTKKWVFDFLDGTLDEISSKQNDEVWGHDTRRIVT